jgi:hypothetical protein
VRVHAFAFDTPGAHGVLQQQTTGRPVVWGPPPSPCVSTSARLPTGVR